MRKRFILAGLCAIVLGGLALAWKPAQVLVPTWVGLSCPEPGICLEDPSKLAQARALRTEALAFVERRLGPIERAPRVMFCSTVACFSRFGHPEWGAVNVGTWGMVLNAERWQPYILRHEMIHLWQNETFGRWNAARGMPRWYIEGMAYELSEDPRKMLPHPDPQSQRETYRAWIAAGNDWRVPPR